MPDCRTSSQPVAGEVGKVGVGERMRTIVLAYCGGVNDLHRRFHALGQKAAGR